MAAYRRAPPFIEDEVANEHNDEERQVAERSMLLKHILIDIPDALHDAIPLDKVGLSWRPACKYVYMILILDYR